MPAERGTYSTRWPFGIGREQVHLDLRHHVAAHRHAVRLREGRRSSATASRRRPGPGRESARRRRAPPAARGRRRGDRGARRRRSAPRAGAEGRRDPRRRGGGPDPPATRCPRPAARGPPRRARAGVQLSIDVDHDPHVRADGLAHGLHAPHLHLRRRLPAEPQLHRAEPVARRGASPRPRARPGDRLYQRPSLAYVGSRSR